MTSDWNEVLALNPKGFVEFNDQDVHIATHGPLKSIRINDQGWVVIELKWAAEVRLGSDNLPAGLWVAVPHGPIEFPAIPFEIESTFPRGQRVRFNGTSYIYIDDVGGLDAGQVFGLVLPKPPTS